MTENDLLKNYRQHRKIYNELLQKNVQVMSVGNKLYRKLRPLIDELPLEALNDSDDVQWYIHHLVLNLLAKKKANK